MFDIIWTSTLDQIWTVYQNIDQIWTVYQNMEKLARVHTLTHVNANTEKGPGSPNGDPCTNVFSNNRPKGTQKQPVEV